MFRKTHSECTKFFVNLKSIRLLGLYDKNFLYNWKYSNQVELVNKFSLLKITVSRYIK